MIEVSKEELTDLNYVQRKSIEAMDKFSNLNAIGDLPNVRTLRRVKECLVFYGLEKNFANKVIAKLKINVTASFFDNMYFFYYVTQEYSKAVVMIYKGLKEELGSEEVALESISTSGLSLEYDG